MTEKIVFSSHSEDVSNELENSAVIHGKDIFVEVGSTTHTSGSSAIATRNITNYPWDQTYIHGNIIAVHSLGDYIAYAIRAPQSKNGMIRIIRRSTEARGLIKNIKGMVRDLAFSRRINQILLGCVDDNGIMCVYKILQDDKELKIELKLEISCEGSDPIDLDESSGSWWQSENYQRIIWCPYIPDEEDDDSEEDNFANLLVVTNGSVAEIWHLSLALQEIKEKGTKTGLKKGYRVLKEHTAPITDAAFSPDGTALATASLDGYVKFFQVYMPGDECNPRCIHQWKPHNGKPLSCLFFLDNHKNPIPDVSFWKFAVTGCCDNTQLKIWSCEDWECHQTITFQPSLDLTLNSSSSLFLKAAVDPAAKFMILSDIFRRVLYIVLLEYGHPTNESVSNGVEVDRTTQSSQEESSNAGMGRFLSITELPIQNAALSFTINDACFKHYKRWKHESTIHNNQGLLDEIDESDNDIVEGLVIKCMFINTKSFQEGVIRFQPKLPYSNKDEPSTKEINLSTSQDSFALKDGLSDLSLNLSSSMSDVEPPSASKQSSIQEEENAPANSDALESASGSAIHDDSSSSSSHAMDVIESLPISSVSASDTSLVGNLSLPLEVAAASVNTTPQNTSMPLLTPESFSSPHKIEENGIIDDPLQNISSPQNVSEPSQSNWKSEDSHSPKSESFPTTPESGDLSMCTVISGSSKSMIGVGSTSISPLLDKVDSPLATSELRDATKSSAFNAIDLSTPASVVTPANRHPATASSTSSPSLEVQLILHSNDGEDDNEEELEGNAKVDDNYLANRQVCELLGINQSPISSRKTSNGSQNTSIIDLFKVSKEPPLSAPASSSNVIEDFFLNPSLLQQNGFSRSLSLDSDAKAIPSLMDLDVNLPSMANATQLTCSQLESGMKKGAQADMSFTLAKEEKDGSISSFNLSENEQTLKKVTSCADLEAEIKRTSSPAKRSKNDSIPPPISQTFSIGHLERLLTEKMGESLNPFVHSSEEVVEKLSSINGALTTQERVLETANSCLLEKFDFLIRNFDDTYRSLQQVIREVDEIRKHQLKAHQENREMLISSVKSSIEDIVRQEVKQALQPAIHKSVENLKYQLSSEIRNISDQLNKSVHSRGFAENLSGSLVTSLSNSMQMTFRETYNRIVIPGFSSVSQQMYSQINDAFTKGTKEYLHHVEKEVQNSNKTFVENIAKNTRALETTATDLKAQSNSFMDGINKTLARQTGITEGLEDRLRHTIREEVNRTLDSRPASRAQTPAPSKTGHTSPNPKILQQQIQQLITQGKFNMAFKQALSVSDLGIVVFVCERINPHQLFSQNPCPLSQDVLLSLINQLSHDLTTFTDIKTKYLEEALMNLDPAHPVTIEHINDVLQAFQRSLNTHLGLHPNHKKLNLLLMAVNHLVAKCSNSS